MKLIILAGIAALFSLPGLTLAESLRCPGGIAAEGDSALSMVYKCGQPQLADSFCAPVYFAGTYQLAPAPFAAIVPCQRVEEWLYERGPGDLLAVVHLRSGVVQSIRYGREPR